MIIKYSDNNENRIEWQHRRGEEWRTAELDELIEAYEREKTGKWISVTERKPEVEQLVWLYTNDNAEPYNVFVGYLNEHGWWVECGVNYSEYSPPCIVAWQPLNKPEPYRG